ncbi:MAG: hypothetical protein LEGION0403_FIIPPAGN_00706 [Legionella sp.]|uniref:hypothetical protein n=1 Tax=Legionella sp. TaxID=459 RepID=UPI003D0CEFE2
MTILEIFKTIFCCGSSTVSPEKERILSATGSSLNPQTYINIGDMLGASGNTTVSVGATVEEDEDDYSLGRTPPTKWVGTGSTSSSPAYALGVNTPESLRSKHRRTSSSSTSIDVEQDVEQTTTPIKQSTGAKSTTSSPGYGLGSPTPSHLSERSVGSSNSSHGYSLGQVDDDEDTLTLQLEP